MFDYHIFHAVGSALLPCCRDPASVCWLWAKQLVAVAADPVVPSCLIFDMFVLRFVARPSLSMSILLDDHRLALQAGTG